MIYCGNCIEQMKSLKSGSVNLIFADPPYFLSNGGLSINSGKVVSVNKGEWDKKENYDDVRKFTYDWLKECNRLLMDDGSMWISCTHHNLYDLKSSIEKLNMKIINVVIWNKMDPPPLIYKTRFKFSYEMIIWCSKGKSHFFDYQAMFKEHHEEMTDVWLMPAVSKNEKLHGYHPTQKPECLLERIIKCSSKVGDVVLDPFSGSGTTCVAAKRLGRKYIGIELNPKYCEIANLRLADIK